LRVPRVAERERERERLRFTLAMRWIQTLCFVVLASLMAKASAQNVQNAIPLTSIPAAPSSGSGSQAPISSALYGSSASLLAPNSHFSFPSSSVLQPAPLSSNLPLLASLASMHHVPHMGSAFGGRAQTGSEESADEYAAAEEGAAAEEESEDESDQYDDHDYEPQFKTTNKHKHKHLHKHESRPRNIVVNNNNVLKKIHIQRVAPPPITIPPPVRFQTSPKDYQSSSTTPSSSSAVSQSVSSDSASSGSADSASALARSASSGSDSSSSGSSK